MKLFIWLLLLTIPIIFGQVGAGYGQIYQLDIGVTVVTVNNSGPLGGSKIVTCPAASNQICELQFSIAGLPVAAYISPTKTSCSSPCSVSFNTELGDTIAWFSIKDNADNPLNPPRNGQVIVPITSQPCITPTFTVPIPLQGFSGYNICWTVNIAGAEDVSNAYIWLWAENLRNGSGSILVNGTEHILSQGSITGVSCNGTVCTITTPKKHNLVTGQIIQLNGFGDSGGAQGYTTGDNALNTTFTVASTPTTTTFTITSNLPSGDWNTGFGPVGRDNGKTFSTIFCNDETRWYGCLDNNHSQIRLMIPLSSTELIAGGNNTLTFKFLGNGDSSLNGVFHGWYPIDAEITQGIGLELSQISVASTTATATLTSGTLPSSWVVGDTILIRDAPGPYWRFNGKRIITAINGGRTTFNFLWGPDASGETPGVAPYTTANGTYTVPTTNDTTNAVQPHMYAARCLIPETNYQYYSTGSFPSYGGNAANGKTAFQTATLIEPNSYFNYTTTDHCNTCHTADGGDLKYLGYHPITIRAAAIHRGMTETQANDIVAYIASLSYPTPARCRPWNPLYQPISGLDSSPIAQWTCGGGLESILTYDEDLPEYMVPAGSYSAWSGLSNFNTREQPRFLPWQFWNQWLPTISPNKFYAQYIGTAFTSSSAWTSYVSTVATLVVPLAITGTINNSATSISFSSNYPCSTNDFLMFDDGNEYVKVTAGCGTTTLTITRAQKSTTATSHTIGALVSDYTKYLATDTGAFPSPTFDAAITNFVNFHNNGPGDEWPGQYQFAYDSLYRWATVKLWEVFNEYSLQNFADQITTVRFGAPDARVATQYTRGWPTASLFNSGAHRETVANLPYENKDTRANRNWVFQTEQLYDFQAGIYAGDRMGAGNSPIDTQYQYSFYSDIGFNPIHRPAFWTTQLTTAFTPQNTMGYTSMLASGNCMIPQAWMGKFTVATGFTGNDLFTPEGTEKPNTVNEIAILLKESFDTFGTSNWITFVNTCGGGTSVVPNPTNAYNLTGNIGDSVAYLLPYLVQYGVSSTIVNSIVTSANTIWAASGHDFNVDKNAGTCVFVGSPRVMKCPNVP